MKNVAIFETAVRLKEAGFPQPMPGAGQFWYNETGIAGVLISSVEWRGFDGDAETVLDGYFIRDFVFAPTATDVLEQLVAINENLAESAALSWFDFNEKKEAK